MQRTMTRTEARWRKGASMRQLRKSTASNLNRLYGKAEKAVTKYYPKSQAEWKKSLKGISNF